MGAATLAAVNNFAPPTILAQASRLNFSTRLFNLLVTNIPGPQFPLYVLGRELEELFPLAFLPQNHALAVAIMSYNGGSDYGLLADYDALPDIDVIADGIDESLRELLQAVPRARAAATPANGEADGAGKPRNGKAPQRCAGRPHPDPPIGHLAFQARTGRRHAGEADRPLGDRAQAARRLSKAR